MLDEQFVGTEKVSTDIFGPPLKHEVHRIAAWVDSVFTVLSENLSMLQRQRALSGTKSGCERVISSEVAMTTAGVTIESNLFKPVISRLWRAFPAMGSSAFATAAMTRENPLFPIEFCVGKGA